MQRRRIEGVDIYRSASGVAAVLGIGLVAACGSSSPNASNGSSTIRLTPEASPAAGTPTPGVTQTPSGTATPSFSATAVPSTVDPCQLVTASEASQLSGGSFASGTEGTTSGGGKTCTYGAQSANVFTVLVGQAADKAAAQAGKAQAQATLQQAANQGGSVTELPNLGDGAAIVSGSQTVSGQSFSAIGVVGLKGLVFYTFSVVVVGHPAPTSAAMQAQAQTVLSRLP